MVPECDEIEAGLWEVDENLCRRDLGEAEASICHAKRKELWTKREARDAENNIVPNGDKKRGRPKTGDFARDTAKVTGESKTSVARKTERGEKIAPDVLAAITGGKWDKGVVLDILKKLTLSVRPIAKPLQLQRRFRPVAKDDRGNHGQAIEESIPLRLAERGVDGDGQQ